MSFPFPVDLADEIALCFFPSTPPPEMIAAACGKDILMLLLFLRQI